MYLIWFLLFLQVSAQRWAPFGERSSKVLHEGSVRLVGGRSSSSGRVEIYHDKEWGTVCDDGWELSEAQVVCRQLGFSGAISATSGGHYGEGSGRIWLDDMKCKGSESSLSECWFKGWAITDCTHKEDAGVNCVAGKNKSTSSIREFSLDDSLGLSNDLGVLFDNGEGCDFNITLYDVNEETEVMFCVHSLILMMYPDFNLTQNNRNFTVEISQTCHTHASAFLRYLYTRQIRVSISSAQCLHQLAHMFGMKKLMEDVGRVFTVLIPEDNTFQTQISMYEYGVRTDDLVLQENVLQYLAWNCEFLIESPAWNSLSFQMMEALLSRSDVVVKDEGFLLEALESWIQHQGDEVSPERQVELLNQIRFLMIPVDQLYRLQFTSSVLRENHEKLYLKGLLRGFQFNVLKFSKIRKNMENITDEYLPRIYTGNQWSLSINATMINNLYQNYYGHHRYQNYGDQNTRFQSFTLPLHTSALYKDKTISWQAQVFLNVQECSNHGIRCNSVPTARLHCYSNQYSYTNIIRYSNRLILTCKQQRNVFHVQDFKNDIAVISTNGSVVLPNPCPNDYSFTFVVRPEYI